MPYEIRKNWARKVEQDNKKCVAGKNFKFLIKSRKVLITRGTSHEKEVFFVEKEGGAGRRGRVKVIDEIPSFLKTIPYLNNPSLIMRATIMSSPI